MTSVPATGENSVRSDDPETREFEFSSLGFIPLSYYKNRDYACFFSANSAQKPALYDTADATANSRINSRLPYIFLLSRIAHHLKLIQRETSVPPKIAACWSWNSIHGCAVWSLKMTDPGDELRLSPARDAKWWWKTLQTTRAFPREAVRRAAFQWKGWMSTCHWFPRCRKPNRNVRQEADENGTTVMGSRDYGFAPALPATGHVCGLVRRRYCLDGFITALGRDKCRFRTGNTGSWADCRPAICTSVFPTGRLSTRIMLMTCRRCCR